ncbi:cob(II)yrinic acid a,c-diamide reductase [Skermanella stibiiresistens SB22]|uniref:Cob(II)yrinic acid a,c-diamide reductase n=1 Tax=Skermanella stibiiresistens SB22 TaxID=1385369 RepID=W9H6E2_9PROT|nr:5,6-dimethylbenzimidazole synthase [Skermanella stibiiresistens]EWY40262.1 cob(II)yrinic acid a,c-diamide reductase [Skermanella stibiiresistens SB22]
MKNVPTFDAVFQERLEDLFRWRRDVRRFRTDPIDDALVEKLVGVAALAPSVGYSRPWRFVRVDDPARRAAVRSAFERCNAEALGGYTGERAKLYATLKLAGLNDAPVQLAVLNDDDTTRGHGLGRRTMPEMLRYSTVTAVHTFWLAARAYGIGVGWVSILDPKAVHTALDVPPSWSLVAYLCVGLPVEEHADPELERAGWEMPDDAAATLSRR